jgi:hypothetical protein
MVALLAAVPPARAELYKWVDEAGNVVYTDKPPPDAQVEVIPPPPPVDSESALEALREQQQKFDTLKQEEQKRTEETRKSEEELAVAKANCELARDKLTRLRDLPRVYVEEKDGTRRRLGEDERQARIAAAEQDIQKYCP